MAHVVEINTLEQLAEYRMAWRALWGAMRGASFFDTYDWLELYWRHFGADCHFRVMAVHAAGECIGIVPLYIRRRRHAVGKLRILTLPMSDWSTWRRPIGPNPTASWYAAFDRVRSSPRNWDLVDLRWQPAPAGARQPAAVALNALGYSTLTEPYQQTSIVQIDQSFEDYLAGRTKKWRHEIRRRLRLPERTGRRITFTRYRPASAAAGEGSPCWELFEECRRLSARSWQAASPDGNTLATPRVEAFFKDCHAAAARLGMLDVALLMVDDQPAAYGYYYHHAGHVSGLRIGYDPDYAGLGVGATLIAHSIRDSFARRDVAFDLGVGNERFKQEYRTERAPTARILHYPPTLRSQTLKYARRAVS